MRSQPDPNPCRPAKGSYDGETDVSAWFLFGLLTTEDTEKKTKGVEKANDHYTQEKKRLLHINRGQFSFLVSAVFFFSVSSVVILRHSLPASRPRIRL